MLYKSPRYVPSIFESIGLSFQKEKLNIDFQDGEYGGNIGILIETILACFDLHVIPILLTKFRVNWSLCSGEKFQNRFSRCHLGFQIRTILNIFIYKSPHYFLSSFELKGLSVQKKKNKIYFKNGGHGGQLVFSSGMNLGIIYLQDTLILHTKFQVNWPFGSGEKKLKIDFQDGGHDGHLDFPIRTLLANFDLKVTPIFPTEFRVNRLFGARENTRNRFSRWRSRQPFWISDLNTFCYF